MKMKLLLIAMSLFLGSMIVCAAVEVPKTITLEMTLADSDTGYLEGGKEILVKLKRKSVSEALWSETYKNIVFKKGGAAIILGNKDRALDPEDFKYQDLEIELTVDESKITVPLITVPYSKLSVNADAAYAIEDDHILYIDRDQSFVGIGTTSPKTRLDVNGEIRIGTSNQEVSGVIRWTGSDFEFWKNNDHWTSLTYIATEQKESKWNQGTLGITQKKVRNVGINTQTVPEKLTVSGDVRVSNTVILKSDLVVTNDIQVSVNYGLSNSGELSVSLLKIGDSDKWENGRVQVSGKIIGNGASLTNISEQSFVNNTIESDKIATNAVTTAKFFGSPITNSKLASGAIVSRNIASGNLGAEHFKNDSITTAKFADESIQANKIDEGVILLDKIPDGVVGSAKIATQTVSTAKLANRAVKSNHIATGAVTSDRLQANSVTSAKIATGAVTYSKLASGAVNSTTVATINIAGGGTGSNAFSSAGILFEENGVLKQNASTFYWAPTENRLGIGTDQPSESVHILGGTSDYFVRLESDGSTSANITLKNNQYEKDISVLPSGNLSIPGFQITPSGYLGVAGSSIEQSVVLDGAIVIGATSNATPGNGAIKFTGSDFQGYHNAWNSLVLSAITFGGITLSDGSLTGNSDKAIVAAGSSNQASQSLAAVGGGASNQASGEKTVIIGGRSNVAPNVYAAIGGGDSGEGKGDYLAILGGASNRVLGHYGTIGGGLQNQISSGQQFGVVGGNQNQINNGLAVVILGGESNHASANYSTIVGGQNNTVSTIYGIKGGNGEDLLAMQGVQDLGLMAVAGGYNHQARGVGHIIVGGRSHLAQGRWQAMGGGQNNRATGHYQTIGGGHHHQVSGQGSTVMGGSYNQVSGTFSQVGGGMGNQLIGRSSGIQGGVSHQVQGELSVVGGGEGHVSQGDRQIILGGVNHQVKGDGSAVIGGQGHVVSGQDSVVSSGLNNQVQGDQAQVLGGKENLVTGKGSVALGTNAKVTHDGTFVFSDRSDDNGVESTGDNQFVVRATGGVRLYADSGKDGLMLDGGSWAHVSNREAKTNFMSVNHVEVLKKVIELDIQTWEYRNKPGVRHIGPTAQDFYSTFELGKDPRHIPAVDADGVGLVAAKGVLLTLDEVKRNTQAFSQEMDQLMLKLAEETVSRYQQAAWVKDVKKQLKIDKQSTIVYQNKIVSNQVFLDELRQENEEIQAVLDSLPGRLWVKGLLGVFFILGCVGSFLFWSRK